jgi:ligand-binding SRPBCC domain-containing protein
MRGGANREFTLERTQVVPRGVEEVFSFFGDPRNLEAVTPPWLRFRIVMAPERLGAGSRLRYRLRIFGVRVRWLTEITVWRPPRTFTDRQRAGPYPLWEHTHRFTPVSVGTEVYDHVRYRVPGGPVAPLVQRLFVGRWLDEIFDYRRERLAALLSSAALRGGTSSSNDPPAA